MPINDDGEFVKRTESNLQTFLENELQSEFGQDVDLSESSVFETLIGMLSGVLAENQEVDMQEVYESAFLDTAEGVNLDRVVEILGVRRISAIKSTGVVTFSRSKPVTNTRNIQAQTVVQTGGSDPIEYVTDDSVVLHFYDGFEDAAILEYTDTSGGAFTVSSEQAFDGTFGLKATGTGTIYRDDIPTINGDQLSCRVYNDAGTAVPDILFGTVDENNTYKVRLNGSSSIELIKVDGGVETVLDDEAGLSIPVASWNEVEIDWGVRNINDNTRITARINDSSGATIAEVSAVDGFRLSGGFGFASNNADTVYFDNLAARGRSVDITASEGGASGNVPANAINTAPVVPDAVETITNPYPTGDIDYIQLDDDTYTLGEDREDDRSLRERTRESLGAAGAATINAIATALQGVQSVQNVSIIENDEPTADAQGRPPFSFEAVIFGGDDQEIIDAIGALRGATSHADGGHVGTEVVGTWTSDVTGDSFTFSFTRPNELAIDMTLELVVNQEYIGDEELRDRVVDYIGGTLSDGTAEIGLGVADNVKIDAVEDVVTGADDTGVVGIVNLNTTPTATTDSNGLEVIDVASNEVASTDATDGSITISTTVE